jgi:hypothetical protein
MPQIFKALITVTIWLMFIFAWLDILFTVIVGGFMAGDLTSSGPPSVSFFVSLAVAIGFAFAGGFLVLVRKKME